MQKRPPVLVGVLVVVVALSVAWMMSIRAGNRLASELDEASPHEGILAARAADDWADVTLRSDVPLQVSLDGPATLASQPLPPGIDVPASAVARPWAEGDRLSFCSPGLSVDAVVVLRGPSGEPQELRLDDVAACAPA